MAEGSDITTDQLDADAARYAAEVVDLLFTEFCRVIEQRRPDILPVLKEEQAVPRHDRALLLNVLQAWGIWFQLLNIAEEITAMRRRRQTEKALGPEKVPGTFGHLIAWARDSGVKAEAIQALLSESYVSPTITAHPTEAKRITVLQIHRRIYILLYRLESASCATRSTFCG